MRHVAGKAVDGSMVTMFFDGVEWPITKIEYADNLTKADVNQLGQQRIDGRTRGKYEVEEKTFEMTKARWEDFLATLPNGFGNEIFQVVVRAEDPDLNPLTSLGSQADTLENCTINGIAGSYENSEAVSMVVIKYKPQQIRWSGKTLNDAGGLL